MSRIRSNHGKITGFPLGIGSLPHTDPQQACSIVLNAFPDSPFLPELPKRSWRESVGVEQTAGLPGFVVDNDKQRLYFDENQDITGDLEKFYEKFLAADQNAFAVADDFMAGTVAMMDMLKAEGRFPKVLKGQLTGPTTLGLILKDSTGKALLYDDLVMDVLIKATELKSRWLVSAMSEISDCPIIFFDEPMLQSIGSAAITIDKTTAINSLRDIVKATDCLTGCHCCGNTDWSILMAAGVDIIALDAWNFGDTPALYPVDLRWFFERGGYIAWGIVPASSQGAEIETEVLFDKLMNCIESTADKSGTDVAELAEKSFVSPSCGLGSLSEAQAESILEKTAVLANRIRT